MATAAILYFGKNVNNFGLDKDILHQIIWEDASRPRGDEYVTKSRNRGFDLRRRCRLEDVMKILRRRGDEDDTAMLLGR